VKSPRQAVEYGFVDLSLITAILSMVTMACLVNVYAHSLRDLYDRYKDDGLFEQNFRYFVTNKRIDKDIQGSLEKKRDRFWYLNNGIIIGCKDFHRDGKRVKLWDFSVINGCQTTTLIGSTKGAIKTLTLFFRAKLSSQTRRVSLAKSPRHPTPRNRFWIAT